MKKIIITMALLLGSASAYADTFLCSYIARISDQDKYNSQGQPLTNYGYTKAAVASIIRQDRANYHAFNQRDFEDESDCAFKTRNSRARLEQLLRSGRISKSAINIIVDYNPLIRVDIYSRHIEVEIIESDDAPRSQVY